jgi:hypothetical protein
VCRQFVDRWSSRTKVGKARINRRGGLEAVPYLTRAKTRSLKDTGIFFQICTSRVSVREVHLPSFVATNPFLINLRYCLC